MSGQQQQSGEGGGGGTGYPNYSTYSQSYFQQQEQQQLRQQQTLPDQAHSSQPEGNPDEMILADKVHSSSQPEGTELNYLQRQQERFKQQVLQQQQQQETATPGVAYQGGYNNLAAHAQSSQYKRYNTPQYYYGQQQQSSNTRTSSGQQVFNTQQPSPVSYGSGQHRQQQQQYYNNSYNTTTNAAYTNYPNHNNPIQTTASLEELFKPSIIKVNKYGYTITIKKSAPRNTNTNNVQIRKDEEHMIFARTCSHRSDIGSATPATLFSSSSSISTKQASGMIGTILDSLTILELVVLALMVS